MNLTISAPPKPTGDAATDTEKLFNWCRALHSQLRRVFYTIDDENITSVSADKIESNCLTADADSFVLTTPDGSKYIKCVDGNLEICADIVAVAEVNDE